MSGGCDFRFRKSAQTVYSFAIRPFTEKCGKRTRSVSFVLDLPPFDRNRSFQILHEDVVRALDDLLSIAPSKLGNAVNPSLTMTKMTAMSSQHEPLMRKIMPVNGRTVAKRTSMSGPRNLKSGPIASSRKCV